MRPGTRTVMRALLATAIVVSVCAAARVGSASAPRPVAAASFSDGTAANLAHWRISQIIYTLSYPVAVSCPSRSTCMLVGPNFGPGAGLWDGRKWRARVPKDPAPPNPPNDSELRGVSCTSSTNCIAVGTYWPARSGSDPASTLPFVERWNGVAWSLQAIPEPPGHGPYSGFAAISCVAPDFCVAVGTARDGGPLVERYDGARWSLQRTPRTDGALNGVACVTDGWCEAVGSTPRRPLAEHWDGVRWRIDRLPSPGPSSKLVGPSELLGISCTASTACTAVGQTSKVSTPIAERWNGRSWALQRIPDIGFASLWGVSCPLDVTCIAVGNGFRGHVYTSDDWNYTTLAVRWDGAKWIREPTPNAAPSSNDPNTVLRAVSCDTSVRCTAVGWGEWGQILRRVGGPGSGLAVTRIRASADGTVQFRVTATGRGRIDILETAWNSNLARSAVDLRPARRRFVYARARTSVTRTGPITMTVVPNPRGRLLASHHRSRVTLRLWVRYTPPRGRIHTLGFYGLHLP